MIALGVASALLLLTALALRLAAPRFDPWAAALATIGVVCGLAAGYLALSRWGWLPVAVAAFFAVAIVFALFEAVSASAIRARRLARLLESPDVGTRLRVMSGSRGAKRHAAGLLGRGVRDPEAAVRLRAVATADWLAKERPGEMIEILRIAEQDADAAVAQEARKALEKIGSAAATPEWMTEVARLRARRSTKQAQRVIARAPAPAGIAAGLAGMVIGVAVTGDVQGTAMNPPTAGDDPGALRIHDTCFLCDLRTGMKQDVVQGTFGVGGIRTLMGPGMAMSKLTLPVQYCELCARESDLLPGVSLVAYENRENAWWITIEFLNDKAAARLVEENPGMARFA